MPGDGEVALTWQAPGDTGTINGDGTAGTITGYTVYYSETPGFAATANAAGVVHRDVGASTLTSTFDGLTNDSTYYFKVRASNATGESAPSTEASAVPVADESRPGAPTGLSFGAYTYDSTANTSGLTLSWTAPFFTGLQGGTATALTGYTVYYAKTENFDTADADIDSETIADAATPTQVFTGLDAGTQYFFKVKASNTNANGEGVGAASAEEATFTNGPPGKPSDIVFDTYTGTSLNISWTAAHPGYKDGSEATISQYTVYYDENKGFDIATATGSVDTANGTTLTAAISGLTDGTGYYFKISATNEFGEGGVSEERLVADNAPPGAPLNLSFSAYSKTGLTVSWKAPGDTGFEGGSAGTLSGYKVYYSTTQNFALTSVTPITISNASTLSQAITGLSEGTQYYFKVTASNAAGEGTASVEASTHTDGKPEAPSSLSMNGHSETGLTVNWNVAGTGYKNGAPAALSGFKVYYSKTQGFGLSDADTSSEVVSDATATSQAISGLDAGTQYYFKVTASNGSGESEASTEAASFTNKASGSPENFAVSLTALTATRGEVTLTWTAPTDKGYSAGSTATFITYKVYSSNNAISDTTGLTPDYTGTELSYTFSGTAGESYYFAVIANNGGIDSQLAKKGPFKLVPQLHLHPNGGSGEVETTELVTGGNITIPTPTGITKSYPADLVSDASTSSIAAWNTAADGSGTYYDLTDTVTVSLELTLYAVWSTDGLEYTLILINNDTDTAYQVKGESLNAIREIDVSGYWKGKKVIQVGTDAFYGFSILEKINLPPTITTIGDYAFQNCTSLVLSSLPDGITHIGEKGFSTARAMTLTSLPSGLIRLEDYAFSECLAVNFTSLPNGLEFIGLGSLQLTKSSFTRLPDSVKTLDDYAFYATNMSSMTIPASVTSLGSSLFDRNEVITEVTLEGDYDTLTDTFKYGSVNNVKLATVNITNDTSPATLGGTVFPSTVTSIKVPATAVNQYKVSWSAYASIISAYSP